MRRPPVRPASAYEASDRQAALRIFVDLWRFALKRKKFWLLPVMIMAVVYGALAVFTKGSVLAPFIYTLF